MQCCVCYMAFNSGKFMAMSQDIYKSHYYTTSERKYGTRNAIFTLLVEGNTEHVMLYTLLVEGNTAT